MLMSLICDNYVQQILTTNHVVSNIISLFYLYTLPYMYLSLNHIIFAYLSIRLFSNVLSFSSLNDHI